MTKIIKAPEKKQRFKPMSEENIIEAFNKKVTEQNDNYKCGFTIDFVEDESLITIEELYNNLQLGNYIRGNSEDFEKQGYHVESYRGALTSAVKVSW